MTNRIGPEAAARLLVQAEQVRKGAPVRGELLLAAWITAFTGIAIYAYLAVFALSIGVSRLHSQNTSDAYILALPLFLLFNQLIRGAREGLGARPRERYWRTAAVSAVGLAAIAVVAWPKLIGMDRLPLWGGLVIPLAPLLAIWGFAAAEFRRAAQAAPSRELPPPPLPRAAGGMTIGVGLFLGVAAAAASFSTLDGSWLFFVGDLALLGALIVSALFDRGRSLIDTGSWWRAPEWACFAFAAAVALGAMALVGWLPVPPALVAAICGTAAAAPMVVRGALAAVRAVR